MSKRKDFSPEFKREDETRFPKTGRERIFEKYIRPALAWETPFIRVSPGATLLAAFVSPATVRTAPARHGRGGHFRGVAHPAGRILLRTG